MAQRQQDASGILWKHALYQANAAAPMGNVNGMATATIIDLDIAHREITSHRSQDDVRGQRNILWAHKQIAAEALKAASRPAWQLGTLTSYPNFNPTLPQPPLQSSK